MTTIVPARRIGNEEFQVEIDVVVPIDLQEIADPERRELALAVRELDGQIGLCQAEIQKLNVEIERLTNHADGLDYTIAVASGILTGLIDSFFVGDYNPNIEDIVTQFASRKSGKHFENYSDARKWLETNSHVDHDSAYNKSPIFNQDSTASNGHTHRLDDLAHHPTLLGLAASIFFQFFRISIFVNNEGKLRPTFVKPDAKELATMWMPVVLSGVFMWLANVAENYAEENLDEGIPEPIKKLIKLIAATPMMIRILRCADTWFSHIMSDVGPKSDGTSGKGIPGIFLSLLKEIATLIPSPQLHQALQQLYNSGTMNFDRELVLIEKLKKQAIPVIINEIIVRGFFFVRRLVAEYRKCNDFLTLDWQNVIPFGNRTVERMMTIASGTFTAVDIADAAIRSAGNSSAFLLRVNFVGVGRFAIAIVTDAQMGIKRNRLRDERMMLYSEMLHLTNAKVFYLEAGMWKSAIDTGKTLHATMEIAEESAAYFINALVEIEKDLDQISAQLDALRADNKDLLDEILRKITTG